MTHTQRHASRTLWDRAQRLPAMLCVSHGGAAVVQEDQQTEGVHLGLEDSLQQGSL